MPRPGEALRCAALCFKNLSTAPDRNVEYNVHTFDGGVNREDGVSAVRRPAFGLHSLEASPPVARCLLPRCFTFTLYRQHRARDLQMYRVHFI